MTHLGPDVVHFHFAEEIACSYVQYAPAAQWFALDRPYQGRSTAAARCIAPQQQEETGKAVSEEDQQGSLHQDSAVQGTSKRRRRKKQKTASIADRPREEQARERHAAVEGFLTAAHLTLLERLNQDRGCAPRVAEQCGDDALQPSAHPAAEPSGHEAAQPLDMLGLAELKGVVKPKLQLQDDISDTSDIPAANLFDLLHHNGRDREVVAEACGVPVLLPARCSFLLSDVRRLQPLLAGTALLAAPSATHAEGRMR